jgi:hypothetical protein
VINSYTSIALGLAFVLVGGINVWLVLESWSRVKAAEGQHPNAGTASDRRVRAHRVVHVLR